LHLQFAITDRRRLSGRLGHRHVFSTKAIVAKLLYRYHIDAVTLIAFRMLFSLPVFAAVALWKMRTEAPLSNSDRWRLIGLGLVGYYLSSYLDFLGLQYISVGLERLILFLTPTFVLLISSTLLKQHIGASSGWRWDLLLRHRLVFVHDLQSGSKHVVTRRHAGAGLGRRLCRLPAGSGEMVKRIGALRLVSYAMCVSSVACIGQFFLLRPVRPDPAAAGVRPLAGQRDPVHLPGVHDDGRRRAHRRRHRLAGWHDRPGSTLFLGWADAGRACHLLQLAGTALVLAGIYLLSKK
jgi:hypothetical protein